MPIGLKGFQKGHGTFPNNHTCKGRVYTKEQREKISKSYKERGFGKWMIGKVRSKETREKISRFWKGKKKGELNPNWKGGYDAKKLRNEALQKLAGRPKPSICEICFNNKGKISFDHDHITGEFRGWICHYCNTALGLVKDNVEVLQKMISYLTQKQRVKLTLEQLTELKRIN